MTQWHPGDELPPPVTKAQREDRRRVITVDAELVAQAIMLLNDHPRFNPKTHRMKFDSYSVAADLSATMRRHGFEPTDPVLFVEE